MSADKSVTYSSTRGCPTQANLSFRDVVMRGLSHDRGLFVPDAFPTVTKEEVESWRSLPYHELATNVIGKFVKDDQVPRAKLAEIVEKSCAAFRSEDVTPVVDVGGHMILVRFFRFCRSVICHVRIVSGLWWKEERSMAMHCGCLGAIMCSLYSSFFSLHLKKKKK